MHTGHTYSLQGFAYRERDVANWRTTQGADLSIPQTVRWHSVLGFVRIGG